MCSLVFVEGNISAGKSSLLRELNERGYATVEESVGHFLIELKAFYEEKTHETCITLQRKMTTLQRAL
jgi:predicted ATPase